MALKWLARRPQPLRCELYVERMLCWFAYFAKSGKTKSDLSACELIKRFKEQSEPPENARYLYKRTPKGVPRFLLI